MPGNNVPMSPRLTHISTQHFTSFSSVTLNRELLTSSVLLDSSTSFNLNSKKLAVVMKFHLENNKKETKLGQYFLV